MTWSLDALNERWKFLALLLGGACLALCQGRWPIPAAAWIAPILLLASIRSLPLWRGFVGFVVIHTAAWEIAYMGMVKMPMFARLGLFFGLSLVVGMVYLADRWAFRRSTGFWTTLVFPTGWVAFDFLNGRFSPNGSWGSIAYTFTDQPELLQVTSLVGWTGLTFLVGWVASVTLWAWHQGCSRPLVLRQVGLCVGIVIAILAFGSARLWQTPPSETVRIASIVGPSSFIDDGEFRRDVWAYTRGIELSAATIDSARTHILLTMDQHMELAERELKAGARVVSFPEANPSITRAEEDEFIAAAARLAREYGAYVGLGLYVFRPEENLIPENTYVLLGPEGSIVLDYTKSKLVPGSSHTVGPGTLPDVETSFGSISTVICFDMDFPALLAQAGDLGTDIVLAPSNDWSEVKTIHARMATVRAVEQGFNLVRPTKGGLSIVTDSWGRTLASKDSDHPGAHTLIAEVPTKGATTLYAMVGDSFSWACLLGFVLLLGRTRVSRRA